MQDPSRRYAIYFTPPPLSPLALFGAAVLGYDSSLGADVASIALKNVAAAELAAATAVPQKYGFHATVVAPFHLKDGTENQLIEALERFCSQAEPVFLGVLQVSLIGEFIALTPKAAVPAVDRLARRAVEFFDVFRATLPEDLARRDNGRLSPRQQATLACWGYPYIFEDFRFHMSLTGPLPAADRERFLRALTEAAHPVIDAAYSIDALSLVRQTDPASKFEILSRRAIGLRAELGEHAGDVA